MRYDTASCSFSASQLLFADTELFLSDDCAVACDVFANQVIKQFTTLTYESLEGACGCEVFVVELEVLCEVLDTNGEKGNL